MTIEKARIEGVYTCTSDLSNLNNKYFVQILRWSIFKLQMNTSDKCTAHKAHN